MFKKLWDAALKRMHRWASCELAGLNRLPPTLVNENQPANTIAGEPSDYEQRIEQEKASYRDCLNVHDLPRIAAYWHERHLLPKFQHFGITHPGEIFEVEISKRCASNANVNQVLSIGSGNCDLEVKLAAFLKSHGHSNFLIECLDLNPAMLARGAVLAGEYNVSEHIRLTECDFNDWQPEQEYDVIVASQSLHHVVKLEALLDGAKRSLKHDGYFLVSDMIGRNGHMRWPEALEIVHEFWRQLPGGYRYNHQLRRYEDLFENWDCSQEGFEGIRSQDILPLLIERFQFEMFLAFGNVIDPFVDRSFGHNFRPETDWDRNFIDRVNERDEAELTSGTIKPTHLVAVMRRSVVGPMRYLPPMTPEFALRRT
ncbi:MAG: class I SAM-dependent methyltransferase [Acidobacteriaceae bacterium]|nr:class I SAM-dependent methyltransferase [Acidobacteriaceae bacterium]